MTQELKKRHLCFFFFSSSLFLHGFEKGPGLTGITTVSVTSQALKVWHSIHICTNCMCITFAAELHSISGGNAVLKHMEKVRLLSVEYRWEFGTQS